MKFGKYSISVLMGTIPKSIWTEVARTFGFKPHNESILFQDQIP